MKTPFAWISAAIAFALIGFLAGKLLTTEDRQSVLSAPLGDVAPSPEVDDRLRATLSSLEAEISRLREAIEALSRREAVEVSSYRETPAVADLGALLASLKRTIESVGTSPSMPPIIESHDPTTPLTVPALGWREDTYEALKGMDLPLLNRAHRFWTHRDVLARYGHPDDVRPHKRGVDWIYYDSKKEKNIRFRFCEGTVYAVALQ
jgi:hypothetical protein